MACYAEGNQQHNRYYHFTTPTPPQVHITRRHDPRLGQQCQVLRGGRHKLVLRMPDGLVMHVPRAWTDADGVRDDSGNASDAVFTVASIRELLGLIESLRRSAR